LDSGAFPSLHADSEKLRQRKMRMKMDLVEFIFTITNI
jgi:hypothetical protein